MHIPVLLETPHVIVVNKPPGLSFHNTGNVAGVVTHLRRQRGTDLPLFPVHRLDEVTSGALLFAKTPAAAREAIIAFRTRQVSKYYVAISRRKPSKKQGSIVGDLTAARRGSYMLLRTKVNPAVTRFTSSALPHGRAFLLKPITGKTHQLRVAMKSIGSPVAGDRRYAALADALLEDRTYLHCAAMRLVIQGEYVQVICRPDQGKAFDENFMDVFDAWFSKGMERDTNLWFPDSKLLKSSLSNSEEYDSRS